MSVDLPRNVLDHLLEGCQVIGPDFRYLYVNEAVARHGRTTREALLGRTMMEVYPGIESTEVFATLRRCMEQRCAANLETQFTFPDGSQGWFELRLQPVPEGVVILSVEITERKRAEAQVHDSQRLAAVGATASMFAHEVGNPLNSLQLNAQVLKSKLRAAGADDVDDVLGRMQSEIQRLNRLLQEFRARDDRGRLELSPTDVPRCLRDVMRVHVQPLAGPGLRVVDEVPAALPAVRGNHDKLVQVFLNLCKNAVEAMPDGGTLTVRAAAEADRVVVHIADTGAGIPDGVDVFAMFHTTKESGMGLGLAIVRQIVEAHRGAVDYDSVPGQGTTFRVALPTA